MRQDVAHRVNPLQVLPSLRMQGLKCGRDAHQLVGRLANVFDALSNCPDGFAVVFKLKFCQPAQVAAHIADGFSDILQPVWKPPGFVCHIGRASTSTRPRKRSGNAIGVSTSVLRPVSSWISSWMLARLNSVVLPPIGSTRMSRSLLSVSLP